MKSVKFCPRCWAALRIKLSWSAVARILIRRSRRIVKSNPADFFCPGLAALRVLDLLVLRAMIDLPVHTLYVLIGKSRREHGLFRTIMEHKSSFTRIKTSQFLF